MKEREICFLPEQIFEQYEHINNKEKLIEQINSGLRVYFNAILISGNLTVNIACGGAICSTNSLLENQVFNRGSGLEFKKSVLMFLERIEDTVLKNKIEQNFIPVHSDIF